jgi:hypothetical protein
MRLSFLDKYYLKGKVGDDVFFAQKTSGHVGFGIVLKVHDNGLLTVGEYDDAIKSDSVTVTRVVYARRTILAKGEDENVEE